MLSPPMSIRSAPAAAISRARSAAARGSRKVPPSEKLSGVTLTMPITSGRAREARGSRVPSRQCVARSGKREASESTAAVLIPG